MELSLYDQVLTEYCTKFSNTKVSETSYTWLIPKTFSQSKNSSGSIIQFRYIFEVLGSV